MCVRKAHKVCGCVYVKEKGSQGMCVCEAHRVSVCVCVHQILPCVCIRLTGCGVCVCM